MLNMELDMYFNRYFYISLLMLSLFSCKKPEDRRCFKSWGEETERIVNLDSFDKLILYEQIEYVLIQDSTDKLVIKGGENMVQLIHWEINDGLLLIRNKSRCNFLRNLKKKVLVEIHFTRLMNIHYEGTEPMTNKDTIQTDYFTLLVRDGAGPVDLSLNAIIISADISHGWGDYTLKGKTNFARIAARSNGFCNAYDLQVADSIEVSSETVGSIKVNANNIPMNAIISNDGNIYYKGIPSKIYKTINGSGKIIDAN
jgi:hypothetical protein